MVLSQIFASLKTLRLSWCGTRLTVGLEWACMITLGEIREHLADLLAHYSDDSVADFEEWLASASWNMHLDSDLEAQRSVGEIQLRLAEIESHNALTKELKFLLSSLPIESMDSRWIVSTGSSTALKFQVWAYSHVGSPHVAAYGLPVRR